jgi:hypothetical protein
MGTNEEIIAQLINSHKRAIRYLTATTVALFITGVVVVILSATIGQVSDIPSGLISIAGVLTSSLGALPVKDILERKEKAEIVTIVQARYRLITQSPDTVDKDEKKRILDLMSQIVAKAY